MSALTDEDIENAPELVKEVNRLYQIYVEKIDGNHGDVGTIKTAVKRRGSYYWTAVWMIEGINNGFSIELEGPNWIRLEAWSHQGEVARATAACRTLTAAQVMMPLILPSEMGPV